MVTPPPSAWFLPGPERMRGGAARHFASDRHFHRGIHLESTCRVIWKKRLVIKGLWSHDLGVLDSFAEARESTLRKPASGNHLLGSHCIRLHFPFDKAAPLIIEEFRPEDTLAGAFVFPTSRVPILPLPSPGARIGLSALPQTKATQWI